MGGWRHIINQLRKVSRRMKRVHAFKRRVVARRMRMFAHCHKGCKRLVKKQKASRKEYKKCYKACTKSIPSIRKIARRTSRRSHRRRARRWRRRMEKSLIPHFVKKAAKRCGCGHFNPIPKCIRKHTPKVCKRCGNCIARKLGKRGGWRYIINQLHKVSRRMKRVHAFKRRVVARRMRMFAHCHKECKRLVKKQKASRKEYKKCYKACTKSIPSTRNIARHMK